MMSWKSVDLQPTHVKDDEWTVWMMHTRSLGTFYLILDPTKNSRNTKHYKWLNTTWTNWRKSWIKIRKTSVFFKSVNFFSKLVTCVILCQFIETLERFFRKLWKKNIRIDSSNFSSKMLVLCRFIDKIWIDDRFTSVVKTHLLFTSKE